MIRTAATLRFAYCPLSLRGWLRGTDRDRAASVFVQLETPTGVRGYGEAAIHPTRGPRAAAVLATLQATGERPSVVEPPPLELARLDAAAREAGLPLWAFAGWPRPADEGYRSVTTYECTEPDTLCDQVSCERPHAVKLKLTGRAVDLASAKQLRTSFPRLPLALDCKGLWTRAEAVTHLRALESCCPDVLWVEDPCPAIELQGRRLPTTLPIFADNALHEVGFDLAHYDGVVLKPNWMSITSCARIALACREAGKGVALGCFLQSSCLTAAALSLAGFASTAFLDLDTIFLIDADPFRPPEVIDGRILPFAQSGLGTEPTALLSWEL